MHRVAFTIATLALAAGPAAACLNDSEIQTHEREFRSQYHGRPAPTEPPASGLPVTLPILATLGGVLAVGAVGLTVRATRARA